MAFSRRRIFWNSFKGAANIRVMEMGDQNEPRVIFHVDMDAFYAAIEQLEHPEWRGRPVIVGGVHSARGVVSTASYEARVFGVHSAMPVREARRLCPQGIFTPGRHDVYHEYSRRLREVLAAFSPEVEPISVDEAFLDMSGTSGLFGPPAAAARRLKDAVSAALRLTASVGVAPNKFLAKIASDLRKPDGLVLVRTEEAAAFLDPLPVEKLMGVGPRTAPALHRLGLRTIGQVRRLGAEALNRALGEGFGSQLYALACGRDEREVESAGREKSLSHEMTFERDCGDREVLAAHLIDLCDRVARRARRGGLSGRTVSLVWRDPDFSRHARSRTLSEPTQDSRVLFSQAEAMLAELRGRPSFRLLGLRLSGFAPVAAQLSLFPPPRAAGLDRAADAVRDRFGEDAIFRGRALRSEEERE